jgi:hypothetical protein
MSKISSRKNKGFLLAGALGIVAVGGVLASAASIGGVTSNTLGSGVSVVASCDTDGVTLAYTNTYNPTNGNYEVTAVTISGIAAACNTKSLAITLADSAKAVQGTGGAAVSGVSQTFAITGNSDAGVVQHAAIVIAG